MRALLLVALLALVCTVSAQNPAAAGPLVVGAALSPAAVANPPLPVNAENKVISEQYLPGKDFLGRYGGVPLNPTAHLQRSLAEDKKYVAAILRAPLDLGDPTSCTHSDIVKDEKALRRIALRINHRRVALRQQQHWIDSATDGLRRIEEEITSTTETARSLAEQLDALTAQKNDITAHVRRAHLLRELDAQSGNLMRLKNARVAEEVAAQERHNKRALQNAKHNDVLEQLNNMRTAQGLALGALEDPKPYRFAQAGLDAAAEEANQQEADTETEADADAENEVEADSEQEVEQEADNQNEAEAEQENEAEAETEAEEQE